MKMNINEYENNTNSNSSTNLSKEKEKEDEKIRKGSFNERFQEITLFFFLNWILQVL